MKSDMAKTPKLTVTHEKRRSATGARRSTASMDGYTVDMESRRSVMREKWATELVPGGGTAGKWVMYVSIDSRHGRRIRASTAPNVIPPYPVGRGMPPGKSADGQVNFRRDCRCSVGLLGSSGGSSRQ